MVKVEKTAVPETPVEQAPPVAVQEPVKAEKPAKKGFFSRLFGNINIEVKVNEKKKKK